MCGARVAVAEVGHVVVRAEAGGVQAAALWLHQATAPVELNLRRRLSVH